MASDAFSVSTQEVIENVSAINQVLTDKVTVLTELAINVQTTIGSLLQSSLKELGSVSSIIESRSVTEAQKVIGDLVTRLQDFPSVITQTVGSLSSRVSNFVKSLPSTLLSSLPSGLGTLPSLVSTLPSQLSSLIPGLPSQLSSLIPGLPSRPRSSFRFGSHGPVLTFYPSFISPFRPLASPSGLAAMAQSLPSTLLSSLPSGLGHYPQVW